MRTYVKRLRLKLGDNARNPNSIFAEPRIGCRMAKGEEIETSVADLGSEPMASQGQRKNSHPQNRSQFQVLQFCWMRV